MMTPIFVASLLLLGLSYPCNARSSWKPQNIECQNNLECPEDHCCVISPMRYSVPQCRPKLEAGTVCRPASASTVNLTLQYPNNFELLVTDVHYVLCPCAAGLTCNLRDGTCKDSGEPDATNLLKLNDENAKRHD